MSAAARGRGAQETAMSRSNVAVVLALTALLSASTLPSAAFGRDRISMRQARRAALAQVPGGTVRSGELEREDGRLIYSFDIHAPGHSGIQEVHVDAYRGNVLSVKHENAVKERTERIGEGVKRAVH
jgi:uncharacterized membrane protein YkoI